MLEKSPFSTCRESRLETCDLLIPGRRGSCSENFPELIADRSRVLHRMLTRPRKHPHALPKRDSVIDGTMRRPVAAVEARRSRSPNVADDVAVMEGWVGKEGGCRIPGRYHPRKLMRVPICNNRPPISGVGSSSRENTSSTQPFKMCPVTLAKSYEGVSFFTASGSSSTLRTDCVFSSDGWGTHPPLSSG
jgi:hypothetical protein